MDKDELRTKFERQTPTLEALLDEVKLVMDRALAEAQIEISAMFGRVKSLESFLAKVERKAYADPFAQNADFVGLRVVCLFTPDLDRVEDVITKHFHIVDYEDKSADLDHDRMGYEGRHYVVMPPPRWAGPRYDSLQGLRCEIQVRTVSQDAWAQISRHLDYATNDLPPPVRRQLYLTSALLESAQEVFDGVNAKSAEYRRQISPDTQTTEAFLLQNVDSETVAAYTQWKFPGLPQKEQILRLFLRDLDKQKYPLLLDIDRVVNEGAEFNEWFRSTRPERYASGIDFLTKAFGFVDPEFRAKHPFGPDTRFAIRDYDAMR